jgi:glycosyltransferase involved in cell wall biosynthesis
LIEKGVPEKKIEIVSNWSRDNFSGDVLDDKLRKEYFRESKINVLYAGNLGIVQSLGTILRAAKKLKKNGITKIQFIFLGGGADQDNLKNFAKENSLDNVTFVPRVESSEVSKYLNEADFLLVHLKKDKLFEITIPSKILAYLKAGKPILMGLKGDAAVILNNAQAGFTFEPDNEEDLIEKLHTMLDLTDLEIEHLGNKAKQYYQDNLSIQSSTDKIEKRLIEVCKS